MEEEFCISPTHKCCVTDYRSIHYACRNCEYFVDVDALERPEESDELPIAEDDATLD